MPNPIDGEYGLDYQIFILRRMVGTLPEAIRDNLNKQIDEIVMAISIRQKLLIAIIVPQLEDLHLDFKALEFDRAITADERDALEARLKEILGDDFRI